MRIRRSLRKIKEFILYKSLKSAIAGQGLKPLVVELEQEVPDITYQYSTCKINTEYLKTKVRGLHAFQVSLINTAIKDIENPVIVDIGDSSGTHLQYIAGLYSDKNVRALSVNIDVQAVERIKNKGFEAVHARAEDLQKYDINADVFLCLETLEHLMNPCFFLHELASKTNAKRLVVTMPLLRKSRIGLHHLRTERKESVCAENTHIFELSPEDWKLVVRHSGWDIVTEDYYLQYPRRSLLAMTRPIWRKYDFEGFYGLILRRDAEWSSLYKDW
jgi:hypothetical protein